MLASRWKGRPQGDLPVGLAVGALGGILVLGIPAVVLVGLLVALGGLFALSRIGDLDAVSRVLFVLTAFTQPLNGVVIGPMQLGDYFIFMSIGVFGLMRLRQARPDPEQTFKPIMIGAVILAVGGLVGSFFEPAGPYIYWNMDIAGFGLNMVTLGRFIFGGIGPIVLLVIVRPDRKLAVQALWAYVIAASLSALSGVVFPGYTAAAGRTRGLAGHPGHLGSISVMALGAAVGLILVQKRPRMWMLATVPLLVIGVIEAGSRAGLGGLVVLALLLGPTLRRRVVVGATAVIAALVLVVVMSGTVRFEGENALARTLDPSSMTSSASDEMRAREQDKVWQLWMDTPLTGAGFNYMRAAHNVYLGVVVSGGVLAAVGFAMILSTIARRVMSCWKDPVVMGAACGYAAYLGAAWFDNVFMWRWLWFFVALLVSLCGPYARRIESAPPAREGAQRAVPAG